MDDDVESEREFERGAQALAGLAGRRSSRLRSVERQAGYARVSPGELVPVEPCPVCADGGLRTAGFVTRDLKLLAVRQCDTCHALEIGAALYPDDDEAPEDGDDGEDDGPPPGPWGGEERRPRH